MTAQILQLNPLQLAPDPFIRVQVGSIARQAFQLDPLGPASSQKVLNGLPPMDWRAIPDDQQLPRNMPEQMLQEAYYIRARVRMILHVQQ